MCEKLNKKVITCSLIGAAFAGNLSAAEVFTATGKIYKQDFDTLPSSGTNLTWANNSTISGWHRNYTESI
jgi:hypothetical protein